VIVVDTSVIAYYMIPGDHTASAIRIREVDPDWIAPQLWLSEFRNVLWMQIRREAVRLEQALEYAVEAESMMSGRSFRVDSTGVLATAAGTGCTAYDSEFVALARTADVPLVTTDQGVLTAAPDVAVHPDDFAPTQSG